MNKIPTPEDFERATRIDKENNRNLSKVDANVVRHFRWKCKIVLFDIFYEGREFAFRVFVFFKKNSDIEAYRLNGIVQEIEEFVCDELVRQGRGTKGEFKVAFEFDSEENVKTNFGGNYMARM